MADFENRHPDARQGDQVALDLFEDGHGQDGWARREIEHAMHGSHEKSPESGSRPEAMCVSAEHVIVPDSEGDDADVEDVVVAVAQGATGVRRTAVRPG